MGILLGAELDPMERRSEGQAQRRDQSWNQKVELQKRGLILKKGGSAREFLELGPTVTSGISFKPRFPDGRGLCLLYVFK